VRTSVSILTLILTLLLGASSALAQPASTDWGSLKPTTVPTELTKAVLTEKKGQYIAADAVFTLDDGSMVRIADFLNKGKPLILQLGYFDCPELCGTIHTDMVDAFLGIDIQPADYFVLSVSINPSETYRESTLKRRSLNNMMLGRSIENWRLLTGEISEINKLADSVGFGFAYIPQSKTYSHPAGLIFIAPDGKITQYLGGLDYSQPVVRQALVEAGQGTVGSYLDQFWLSCAVMLNSASQRPLTLLRFAATGMVLLIVGFYAFMFLRMQVRKHRQIEEAAKLLPKT
jgi:protein SCO1